MSYEFIEVEKKERLLIVTINRPDVLNCLHGPAHQELSNVFDNFAQDDEAWVAIITGKGPKSFCAGLDVKWFASQKIKKVEYGNGGFGGITERHDLFKPVIAAVNGFALGGGFEIAMACDIIIAAEHAAFGLPEPRVGLMAGAGGVHRLPRQIPFHQAMGMMLTGTRIDAREAQRLGVVNEVVPADQLMGTAEKWAGLILECAPLAVRASKQAALIGLHKPLNEAIRGEYDLVSKMRNSEDLQEGPRAFAEKRKPVWKGR